MRNLLTIALISLTLVACGKDKKETEPADMSTAGVLADDMSGAGTEVEAGEMIEAGTEVDMGMPVEDPLMAGDMMIADMGMQSSGEMVEAGTDTTMAGEMMIAGAEMSAGAEG